MNIWSPAHLGHVTSWAEVAPGNFKKVYAEINWFRPVQDPRMTLFCHEYNITRSPRITAKVIDNV